MSKVVLKNRLREFRKRYDLSQAALASYAGCSKNAISAIENGVYSPTAKLALRFCVAFACKFDDLFYLEADKLSDQEGGAGNE